MQPSRIELLDPANIPFQLVDLLLELKVPYDIFVADAGLLGPHGEPFWPQRSTPVGPEKHADAEQERRGLGRSLEKNR